MEEQTRVSNAIEAALTSAIDVFLTDGLRNSLAVLRRHCASKLEEPITVAEVAALRALAPDSISVPGFDALASANSDEVRSSLAKIAAALELYCALDLAADAFDILHDDSAVGEEETCCSSNEGDEGDKGHGRDASDECDEGDGCGNDTEGDYADESEEGEIDVDDTPESPPNDLPASDAAPRPLEGGASQEVPGESLEPEDDTSPAPESVMRALLREAGVVFPFLAPIAALYIDDRRYEDVICTVEAHARSSDAVVARLAARVLRRLIGLVVSSRCTDAMHALHARLSLSMWDHVMKMPLNCGGSALDYSIALRRLHIVSEAACDPQIKLAPRPGAGFGPSDFSSGADIRILGLMGRALEELDPDDALAQDVLQEISDIVPFGTNWPDDDSPELHQHWWWHHAHGAAYQLAVAPIIVRAFSAVSDVSEAGLKHLFGSEKDAAFRRDVCGDSDAREDLLRTRLTALFKLGAYLLRESCCTVNNGVFTMPTERPLSDAAPQWSKKQWAPVAAQWRLTRRRASTAMQDSLSPAAAAAVAAVKAEADKVALGELAFRKAARRKGWEGTPLMFGITPVSLSPYSDLLLRFILTIATLTATQALHFPDVLFERHNFAITDLVSTSIQSIGQRDESATFKFARLGLAPVTQRLLTARLRAANEQAYGNVQYSLHEFGRVYSAYPFTRGPRSEPYRVGPVIFPSSPEQAEPGGEPDVAAVLHALASTSQDNLARAVDMAKNTLSVDSEGRSVPGQEASPALIKAGFLGALASMLEYWEGDTEKLVDAVITALSLIIEWRPRHDGRAFRSQWTAEFVLNPVAAMLDSGILPSRACKEIVRLAKRVVEAADIDL